MNCPSCNTPNFRDFKYCRECGTRLPAPEPLDAAAVGAETVEARVESMLQEALTALEEGRFDEAALAAQGALALNAESPSAHSVLGLIYERQGKTAEAIAHFQRVLELNPGSVADRQKLNALLGTPPPPPRRFRLTPGQTALAVAACAGTVVFGAGLLLVSRPETTGAQSGAARLAPATSARAEIVATPKPLPEPKPLSPADAGATTAGRSALARPSPASRPSLARDLAPRFAPPDRWEPPLPQPERRIGLPPVLHTPPAPRSAATGLPPAAIGEIVPIVPPMPGARPGPGTAGAAAPGAATPAGGLAPAEAGRPPHLAGAGPMVAGGAPEAPGKETAAREPFEPETGFIRIGPARRPAEPASAPAAASEPPAGTPRPSISIRIQSATGERDGAESRGEIQPRQGSGR